MHTPEHFNRISQGTLIQHLGIRITQVEGEKVRAEFEVQPVFLAPNGFLHAGSVVTLADTTAGCGCLANLPEGANGFTTIELKSNHLSTAKEGFVDCEATLVHKGRSTQVWDAVVTSRSTGKTMALFRCTQMILYPR